MYLEQNTRYIMSMRILVCMNEKTYLSRVRETTEAADVKFDYIYA